MAARKGQPCSLCGRPVNPAGRGTAEHTDLLARRRCDGSDLAYAAHREPRAYEIRVPKPSPFRRTLARLRGCSITHVDFREARLQRSLGHVTERAHALRFIRLEVRDG